ncbi:MAG: CpaD family pilus assembly protein [Methyloligellaceae bacterium]
MKIFRCTGIESFDGYKRLAIVLGLSICTVMATGCNQRRYELYPLEEVKLTHEERHPIQISTGVKQVAINLDENQSKLTAIQKDRLSVFFASYRQRGQGQIEVAMPSGGASDSAAYRTAGNIKEIASRYGIAPGYLHIRPYRVAYEHESTIRVSYNYSIAKGPKCDEWYENVGKNYTNLHYHNFGCSQQRNLAAMIANPRDLVEPRGTDSRSGERRDVIWDKYIKGETTVSQRAESEKGTVSEVAK